MEVASYKLQTFKTYSIDSLRPEVGYGSVLGLFRVLIKLLRFKSNQKDFSNPRPKLTVQSRTQF